MSHTTDIAFPDETMWFKDMSLEERTSLEKTDVSSCVTFTFMK